MAAARASWGSRLGFVLAAAGSAVGLGNLWRFPYVTGENGGGAFVLLYLLFIFLIGMPIMVGEVMVGRMAQRSPVGAYRKLSGGKVGWATVGGLGVLCAFVILSYYSVVAGWCIHYIGLSISGELSGLEPEQFAGVFSELVADGPVNVFWQLLIMGATISIVLGGIKGGVERASKIMMPTLLAVLVSMLIYAMTLDGFDQAMDFVFGFRPDELSASSILEALGQSFFTLSLGMGAMLTYGSYMTKDDDIVGSSVIVGLMDTFVAVMACMVLFPITYTSGLPPATGPGLVFVNMPLAFSQLPGGALWTTAFFVLLTFAALTSAISLLEVAVSYFIDERGWSRKRAVSVCGGIIALLGIPSALSGGSGFFGEGLKELIGRSWFDSFDHLATNWFLPVGGLSLALFVGWKLEDRARKIAFQEGLKLGMAEAMYVGWLRVLKYLVPIAITLVILKAVGVID